MMNSPTDFLRVAIPAALEAGKAIMKIYKSSEEKWMVEEKADHTPLTLADKMANKVIMKHLKSTNIPIISEENQNAPYEERKQYDKVWLVDPLDGTKEFIKKNDEFTVNIALVEKGVPVAGVIFMPAKRTLYFGVEGFGAFRLGDVTVAKNEREMMRAAVRLPMDYEPPVFTVVASRSHMSDATVKYVEALKVVHPDLQLISAGSSIKLCKVADGSADVYPRLAPTMEWDTAAGDAIARAGGCDVLAVETGLPLVYNKENLQNPEFVVEAKRR